MQEVLRLLGTAEQGIDGHGGSNNSKAEVAKSDFEDGRVRAVNSGLLKEHRADVSFAGSVTVVRDSEDQ